MLTNYITMGKFRQMVFAQTERTSTATGRLEIDNLTLVFPDDTWIAIRDKLLSHYPADDLTATEPGPAAGELADWDDDLAETDGYTTGVPNREKP